MHTFRRLFNVRRASEASKGDHLGDFLFYFSCWSHFNFMHTLVDFQVNVDLIERSEKGRGRLWEGAGVPLPYVMEIFLIAIS